MGALQYVDVPGYAALILRRTFPELEQPDNLIPQSLRWFATAPGSAQPRYNQQDHEWTFPSGAVIRFGHLDGPNAILRYQGGGYHYIGFDEVTHFAESDYEFLGFSRTRKPRVGPLSEVPIRVRASANPGGPGHGWVKKRFITHRKPGVVFIPSKVWDNPGIDPDDYARRLGKMAPSRVKQLLDGDWGAFEGAAFEDFNRELHCVMPFEIPSWFDRFESMDYGSSNPTAWAVWAVDHDHNLVIFGMHYAPGLPSETAPIILKRRQLWGSSFAVGDPQSLAMPTTNLDKWGKPATIQNEFADLGVAIGKANNEPRAGYTRLRELLRPDPEHPFPEWHPRRGEKGSPRLFIFELEELEPLLEQFETAVLAPEGHRWAGEMIDPDWEGPHGHAVAMARYGAMTRPPVALKPPPVPETEEDLRETFLREVHDGKRALTYAD